MSYNTRRFFSLVTLSSLNANEDILRSTFLRKPVIRRSFILPSLQHIPHHKNLERDQMQMHWPTNCKPIVRQQIAAPSNDYYFLLSIYYGILTPPFYRLHFPKIDTLKIFGCLHIISRAYLLKAPVLDKYAKMTTSIAKSNHFL